MKNWSDKSRIWGWNRYRGVTLNPVSFEDFLGVMLWWSDEKSAGARRRAAKREEGLGPWVPMNPWPDTCQVCGKKFIHQPKSVGHEPPIEWARAHPEYAGPFVLRPECLRCNKGKHCRPDWEMEGEA